MPMPPDRSQTVFIPNSEKPVVQKSINDAAARNRAADQASRDAHVGSGAPGDPIKPRQQSGMPGTPGTGPLGVPEG